MEGCKFSPIAFSPTYPVTSCANNTSNSLSVIMRLHAVAACLVLLAVGSVFAQQTGSSASADAQGGAAKPQAAGTPGQFTLAAFTNITSCLPFNILIKPSATGSSSTGYTLTTSVAPEVNAALNVAVANSTLYLGFNRRFESTVPIRVTVTMPADKLEVVANKGMGNIIINPGKAAGRAPSMHALLRQGSMLPWKPREAAAWFLGMRAFIRVLDLSNTGPHPACFGVVCSCPDMASCKLQGGGQHASQPVPQQSSRHVHHASWHAHCLRLLCNKSTLGAMFAPCLICSLPMAAGFKVTANTVSLITTAGGILARNLSTPQLFVEASG
jgi:hypothetical protein